MARELGNIIVVDVEATCWDGEIPDGMRNEITEIGVSRLWMADLEIERLPTQFINPDSEVSEFCTNLTTLTKPFLEERGGTFRGACDTLRKSVGRHVTWASWGDYDRKQFEREIAYHKSNGVSIQYPFGRTHINVKNLFAIWHNLRREVGVSQALDIAGLTFDGTAHRGEDDAYNIAKLLGSILLMQRGGQILTCVYCGQEYPRGTKPHGDEALTEHIQVCEKHPMRNAEDVMLDKVLKCLRSLPQAANTLKKARREGRL